MADGDPAADPPGVRLDIDAGTVSHDPRARRRRTLRPDRRALPLNELTDLDAVYGYSFIVTNLDVTTPAKATAIEQWYRHRTEIKKDARRQARCRAASPPVGSFTANAAWLAPAAIADNLTRAAGCLTSCFHATAHTGTLRRHLITLPARIARRSRRITLRLPLNWSHRDAFDGLLTATHTPPHTA